MLHESDHAFYMPLSHTHTQKVVNTHNTVNIQGEKNKIKVIFQKIALPILLN